MQAFEAIGAIAQDEAWATQKSSMDILQEELLRF